jgi:hypothetical protein
MYLDYLKSNPIEIDSKKYAWLKFQIRVLSITYGLLTYISSFS